MSFHSTARVQIAFDDVTLTSISPHLLQHAQREVPEELHLVQRLHGLRLRRIGPNGVCSSDMLSPMLRKPREGARVPRARSWPHQCSQKTHGQNDSAPGARRSYGRPYLLTVNNGSNH